MMHELLSPQRCANHIIITSQTWPSIPQLLNHGTSTLHPLLANPLNPHHHSPNPKPHQTLKTITKPPSKSTKTPSNRQPPPTPLPTLITPSSQTQTLISQTWSLNASPTWTTLHHHHLLFPFRPKSHENS